MNAERAREYFSQHFEGTLDKGLKQSFEQALEQDAQIQAEYRAFARTMEQLQELSAPVPEPGFDLHEHISQRLDRHFFELDRKPVQRWLQWRRIAVGALVAGALVAAATSLILRQSGDTELASPVPVAPKPMSRFQASSMDLQQLNGKWTFTFQAQGNAEVSIYTSADDQTRKTVLDNDLLTVPLENATGAVQTVRIDFGRNQAPISIALPPSQSVKTPAEGEGDLQMLAMQAAGYFGRPVVLVPKDDAGKLSWSFKPERAAASIGESIAAFGYLAEQRASGAIWILPQ